MIKNQAGQEARKRKVGGEVQVHHDPDPVQDHGIANLNVVVDHDRGQDRDHHHLHRRDLKNEVDIENKLLKYRQFSLGWDCFFSPGVLKVDLDLV